MNLKRKDYMKQHSFTDFVYEVIGELRQENRFATAYIYHYALQAFTASVGGGKIFWGGLNRRSLCKFQYYLEKEQKSYNTTSTYIRALRAIYNSAVDRGVVAGECRLFVNLKTGVSSEHKRHPLQQQHQSHCVLRPVHLRREYRTGESAGRILSVNNITQQSARLPGS